MAEYENRTRQQATIEEVTDLIVTVLFIVLWLYCVYLALT